MIIKHLSSNYMLDIEEIKGAAKKKRSSYSHWLGWIDDGEMTIGVFLEFLVLIFTSMILLNTELYEQ